MKNEIRKRENQKERERERAQNKNRKTYLLLQFSGGCRPRVGEREKKRVRERGKKRVEEREKKRVGREMVTNVTYHKNIIVIEIVSYDIVIYVYRGVKSEEK